MIILNKKWIKFSSNQTIYYNLLLNLLKLVINYSINTQRSSLSLVVEVVYSSSSNYSFYYYSSVSTLIYSSYSFYYSVELSSDFVVESPVVFLDVVVLSDLVSFLN